MPITAARRLLSHLQLTLPPYAERCIVDSLSYWEGMLKLRAKVHQAISLVALLLCAQARAQDAADRQVFDQSYFVKYNNIVNAEDMLIRVPGVQPILDTLGGGQDRGFGSGGDQVLLNGKRFAGKGQVLNALRRIQSAKVQRIEMIRGNLGGLTVLSEGLIINVVLVEGASTGSGSWQANARFNDRGRINGDGLISYSDSLGALDYNVGLERKVWSGGMRPDPMQKTRIETFYYPNGVVRDDRPQEFWNKVEQYIASANLTYNFENGDRLRLNVLADPSLEIEDIDVALSRYNPDGTLQFTGHDLQYSRQGWETQAQVGGDYESMIGNSTRLNVIFIHSYEKAPENAFRNIVRTTGVTELSRSIDISTNMESILRGSVSLPLSPKQTLEVGAEGARNVQRQFLRPFFDLNADGRVEEVTVPTARPRVQELRGEAFANHTWQLSGDLSLSSSFNVEISRITNNYPFSPAHTYIFPKPRVDLRYDLTASDQLRFKVERLVSQLDFSNFVPSFDIINSEIDAGNPDLKPEREWEFEFVYQKQLPQNQGLLQGTLFYKSIQGHISKFTIRTDPDGARFSALGNIGNGYHYGFDTVANVRLTALGLPDVVIDARFKRNFSRVTDPFTGIRRPIGRSEFGGEHWKYQMDIGFRHDVTAWGFSYGATYDDRHGDLIDSDIRIFERESQSPRIEAFAEKKLVGNLVMRVEGYGLIWHRSRESKRRTQYIEDVSRGTVLRFERFTDRLDRLFMISLRGTF